MPGFKSQLPKKPGIYVFLFVLRHAGCATEAKLPRHLMLGLCVAHC